MNEWWICCLSGGENEDDMSTMVYYLNGVEHRWELKSDQMLSGVTETTIHSSFAVVNIEMDFDWAFHSSSSCSAASKKHNQVLSFSSRLSLYCKHLSF